jgi:hypothetical protein
MDYQTSINLKYNLKKKLGVEILKRYNKGIDITLKFYDKNGIQPVNEIFDIAGLEQGE